MTSTKITPGERARLASESGSRQDAEAATAAYAATLTVVQLEALAAEYARMELAGVTTVRARSRS
jgi:hypothetical protein